MMTGSYDPALVLLSFFVATIASYTALELARRVATSEQKPARLWLIAGAFSMGIGIWTMHFVGMLAFSMPMSFTYDVPLTIVSLLVGVAASAFTIFVASRKYATMPIICVAGVILGCGIAGMHYTGMAAMRMDATIVYDRRWVAVSIAIAVVAAIAAIWIAFTLLSVASKHLTKLKLGAAVVMGIAICGMHYTGMIAAQYMPISDLHTNHGAQADQTTMAVAIAIAALMILGFTHLTIFFDYRLGQQKDLGEKLSAMVKQRTAELEQRADDLAQSNARLEFEASERIRVEKQALYLSQILDESSNEIYVFDEQSLRFAMANKGAVVNSGYTQSELLEMTPIDLTPEFDQSSFTQLVAPLRDRSRNDLLLESTHRRKDGTTYPVQIHLQRFEHGQSPVFVAAITDVTARKQLESDLMQARKLESIGQLAAGVAHEINTPAQFVGDNMRFLKDSFSDLLGLINAYQEFVTTATNAPITPESVALVDDAVSKADPDYLIDEIPTAIEQSLDGISRISHIVRAMKEFSHPGGKERELLDLNRAIDNTVTVASNEWKYAAEIVTEFDDTLPPVPCTPQEITQVILNLIVNASHAIVDAQDSDAPEKGTITIATSAVDEAVEIRIADTGSGIPAEIRERVFDPFFTTKEVGRGTGQGLSMAYATIVEKHRGTLRLESEVGKGTTFYIRLPLADADEEAREAAA